MIYSRSRIRSRFLLRLCAFIFALLGCGLLPQSRAQNLDKPLQNIDEDITTFEFAPDGRIVYSVRRTFKVKKYEGQHDDIWLMEAGGKRRRLLQAEKFSIGTTPFSYAVDSFRWSPSGHLILARLLVAAEGDDSGRQQNSYMTLVLDDSGHEIHLGKGDAFIKDALNAIWLQDSSTIVYMIEALEPRSLFSFKYSNVATGPAGMVFEGRTFLAAEPIAHTNSAIAVEQDRARAGPPRLQRLDLLAQDDKELATLDGYEGGLCISPSGKKAAYFVDREVLEIRDLVNPTRIARLRVGLGVLRWSPDESRIFLKRATEKKSADLVAIDTPQLVTPIAGQEIPVMQPTPQPLLHGITIREFEISSDSRFLAVELPGKHNLLVFPFTY